MAERRARDAVVVIGASAGIGLAIAREFASLGHDVVLVARNAERLDGEAAAIQRDFGIKVVPVSLDATAPDASTRIADVMATSGLTFGILVITVGAWSSQSVAQVDGPTMQRILDHNVTVPLTLCRTLVPSLMAARRRVLFVGSLAGCMPVPWISSYGGAKAGLHAAVLALRQEWAETNVSVSLLAPGAVLTEFVSRSSHAKLRWVVDLFASTPQTVARAGVRGVMSQTPLIVPGVLWRFAWLGSQLLPRPVLAIVVRFLLKPIGPSDRSQISPVS